MQTGTERKSLQTEGESLSKIKTSIRRNLWALLKRVLRLVRSNTSGVVVGMFALQILHRVTDGVGDELTRRPEIELHARDT